MAATNGSVDILSLFLDNEAKLDLSDNDGSTVLQIAVSEGHFKFVKILLRSIEKETPVMYQGNKKPWHPWQSFFFLLNLKFRIIWYRRSSPSAKTQR